MSILFININQICRPVDAEINNQKIFLQFKYWDGVQSMWVCEVLYSYRYAYANNKLHTQ